MLVLKGRDQVPINPDLKTACEKCSSQVVGQLRRAIFDIVADDFHAVYSQKKHTALFTHFLRCRGVGYREMPFKMPIRV